MTQPHYIDSEAVALWGCADGNGVDPRLIFRDKATADQVAADTDMAVRPLYTERPSPMEDVAWREKLKGPAAWLNRWAAHVGGCRGGQVCTCGLTMAQFEIEQALALIATHPVQGGEE